MEQMEQRKSSGTGRSQLQVAAFENNLNVRYLTFVDRGGNCRAASSIALSIRSPNMPVHPNCHLHQLDASPESRPHLMVQDSSPTNSHRDLLQLKQHPPFLSSSDVTLRDPLRMQQRAELVAQTSVFCVAKVLASQDRSIFFSRLREATSHAICSRQLHEPGQHQHCCFYVHIRAP